MTAIKIFVLFCVFVTTFSKSVRQSEVDKQQLEQYIEGKKKEINPRYRPHYHVAGPVGWINDPNGFSFYDGQYHLFFQYYPYDAVWGPMHWGHVSSPDLVNWRELPTALLPDEEMCFSGSAVDDGGIMTLMYTGHIVTDTEPYYTESQYLAFSDDGVNFDKYDGNPVLSTAPNGSHDFRDPKVWRHGDHWYVIIGSKTPDERGQVLLYRSDDLKQWEFLNVIGESDGSMGYMWECPDFFELNGKFVLLMSPQGLEPVGDRYKNLHQNGYIIGNFNYETFEFIPEVSFQEIDYGHDFYAAQTMERDGIRYLISWFNMWETPNPEEEDGWAGAMTIVRELELVENRILMKPVENIVSLRGEPTIVGEFDVNQKVYLNTSAAEVIIEGSLDSNIELLIQGGNGGDKALLQWDPAVGKVVVDRNGDVRQVEWQPLGSHSWRIFLDASCLELFCGEGEVVFSSRVYPDGEWTVTNLSPQILELEAYPLSRSVPYP